MLRVLAAALLVLEIDRRMGSHVFDASSGGALMWQHLPGNVTTLNVISSVGSWILALSILVFLWNVYVTGRHGVAVTEEDPWGYCSSLEWATSCPPPRHNFYRIPRIRSERPAFEAHYPHIKWGRESRGLDQKIPATSNVQNSFGA